MSKYKKFKKGNTVYKVRPYSWKKYCRYGGTSTQVPLGTKGTISELYEDGSISIKFDNLPVGCYTWAVDPSEISSCPQQRKYFK